MGEDLTSCKPIILLVDDDEDILDFISDDLEDNYLVKTALDGCEALKIIQTETVHCIVSDVMMPLMNGFELCNYIKSDFENSHIPVIFLTAKKTLQSKIEGLEFGADAYIEKPFSPKHLKVQIANLLANRNKIKEYFANSPLAHISSMAYSKADELFLEKLNNTINDHLQNISLDVDELACIMNMSRSTLYRKIKAISNLSANELINIARLKKAAELLASGMYKVYEVAELVGFTSQNYFSRSFHKQFGVTATDYIMKVQNNSVT